MADEQHVLTTAAIRPGTSRWLIAGAMLLTGLSMRRAVTSVGPILSELEAGLHVSTGVAGIVTTLPVVCFAIIGTTAPRLSHRYGEHLPLVGCMSLMTVGVVARALAGGHRRLVIVLVCCYVAAYLGLALAPISGAWLWMLFAGAGAGLFPLSLTMFGLRTHAARATAALATFAQGIGYLLAGQRSAAGRADRRQVPGVDGHVRAALRRAGRLPDRGAASQSAALRRRRGRSGHEMIRIEPLTAAHAEAVLAIYQAGLDDGNASFEITAPTWAGFDAERRPDLRYVATVDGTAVGWIACRAVSPRAAYRGVVEHSVFVTPTSRGHGVGRALLEALLGNCTAVGVWTVQSSIFPENTTSLALHHRAGFRLVGVRERIGRHRGVWRDTILVEWRNPAIH